MDKKEVVGFIPNLLFKLFLYLKDRFDPKTPISQEETIFFEICVKLLKDPDSELFSSSQKEKRFIKNRKKNTYILIEKNVISITNEIYTYSFYINDFESYRYLNEEFDKLEEIEIQKIESEVKILLNQSLKNILKGIN